MYWESVALHRKMLSVFGVRPVRVSVRSVVSVVESCLKNVSLATLPAGGLVMSCVLLASLKSWNFTGTVLLILNESKFVAAGLAFPVELIGERTSLACKPTM